MDYKAFFRFDFHLHLFQFCNIDEEYLGMWYNYIELCAVLENLLLKGRADFMKMQLSEIARVLEIEDIPNDWQNITITSVSFDSRKMKEGALFVPLKGEHDGHQYIQNAIDANAQATLWQKNHRAIPTEIPALVVDDTLEALQKLAKYYLQKINPQVVAVTGSNGKTTTKDMIAAVLKTQYNVTKTFENFNNEIGVPITCLSMEPNTEVLVVEMGMDRFEQLDKLSHLVDPDVAVITMIGEAHIEFFGTRDKIADAKMEITHGLKEDGVLVYNGDEPLLHERAQKIVQETQTFGLNNNDDDLTAENIKSFETRTTFDVPELNHTSFEIPMLGDYNVKNALASLLVGRLMHISTENMQLALKDFALTKNRTEWVQGALGEQILSDVYNSNPTAVKAVLNSFEKVETKGKRIVLLGDMLELGEKSAEMHASLAQEINPDKIDEVYLYGNEIRILADQLGAKMPAKRIHYFPLGTQEQMIENLKASITKDDVIMLKGSHGMHLENVLQALKK